MAQRAGYNDSNGTGFFIGAIAFGILGYMRWGWKGVLAAVVGALIGTLAETVFTAGREGKANLLLPLAPLTVFGVVAYFVWKYFR